MENYGFNGYAIIWSRNVYHKKYSSMEEILSIKKRNLEKKEKDNSDLWIYDKDINNAIKKFLKTEVDYKYYLI